MKKCFLFQLQINGSFFIDEVARQYNLKKFRFFSVSKMSESPEKTSAQMTSYDVEKLEEEKLKAKYPGGLGGNAGRNVSGHSAFLQKRLAKGVSATTVPISTLLIVCFYSKSISIPEITKWQNRKWAASINNR